MIGDDIYWIGFFFFLVFGFGGKEVERFLETFSFPFFFVLSFFREEDNGILTTFPRRFLTLELVLWNLGWGRKYHWELKKEGGKEEGRKGVRKNCTL